MTSILRLPIVLGIEVEVVKDASVRTC